MLLKKRFDSEPIYKEKYLRTKVKFHKRKFVTKSHGDKKLKEGCQCICLSVILIDSVFRTGRNYFPQVILEECKHFVKEKEMPKYINDNLKISFDENSDETNSHEENYSKE